MNDSPIQIPPPPPCNPSITLAKLAAILAVIAGLAFGLCGLAATAGMSLNEEAAGRVVYASLVVEAISLIGLLATGVLAILQSIRRRKQSPPNPS